MTLATARVSIDRFIKHPSLNFGPTELQKYKSHFLLICERSVQYSSSWYRSFSLTTNSGATSVPMIMPISYDFL